MKKITVSIILIICIKANACDICGCGVGNTYVGVLPEFRKHIIGIRYRSNSIITHVGIGGATTYLTTNEYYNTSELWGGFRLAKKWRLLTSLPYNFNSKTNSTSTNSKNGVGDINNVLFYELFNKKSTTKQNKLLISTLWLGAGLKLPTGSYNPIDKNNTSSNNLFQLGTGSTDFLIAAMYDLRYQDAGININSSYKINTANKYNYQYGNKFTLSSQLYYKFKIANKFSVVPNAGIIYEVSRKDKDNNEIADVSGGNLTFGSVGLEASYKKIAIGFNWQTSLQQNIAMGIIHAKDRAMLHISLMF
jgi:hypothetical protein